jgi:hypothetical protein
LADRGFVHPDASYDRAYVYVERARSRARRPGDLGRALAALEEAELLRPGDDGVSQALTRLRSELSRERARSGSSPTIERPTLGRAVAGLLPENVWAIAAIVGSSLVTLGLLARALVKQRSIDIAGAVAIAVGLVFGSLGGALVLLARHYRVTSHPAVVVVTEARLLDADGRALPVRSDSPSALPEGVLVYVHQQKDGRAQVEWGTLSGWVESSSLRVLATQPSSGQW